MKLHLTAIALLSASFAFGQEETKSDQPKKLETGKIVLLTQDKEELEIERAAFERANAQQDRWFHDGDYPAIIAMLRYQYEVYPFSDDVNTSLGWMYGNTAAYDKELAVYSDYFKRNPQSVDGPYPLAQHYYIKRDYVMVTNLLAPVVKLKERSHPNTYRMLAQSYSRLGLAAQAVKVYDKYLDVAPDDLAALAHRNRLARDMNVPERVINGHR